MGDAADDAYEIALQEFLDSDLIICERAWDCFDNNIWITQDGTEIPLEELEQSHLDNIINFIKRGRIAYGIGTEWLPKLEEEVERRFKR